MDPNLLVGGGLVLLGMGAAMGFLVFGRRTMQPLVEIERRGREIAEAELKQERDRSLARSRGAEVDLDRDVGLAAAGDDPDRVLDAAFGPEPGPAPGEQGAPSDEGGA